MWHLYHYHKHEGGDELAKGKWKVIFYQKSDGAFPVFEFIESLTPKLNAKLYRDIGVLQDYGNANREPYSKYLDDGIFELRTNKVTIRLTVHIEILLHHLCQDDHN